MMWELDDLAANSDLAEQNNVLRSTIVNWVKRYPDFPKPITVIGGRPVWSSTQVAAWVAVNCDNRGETA